MDIRICFHNSDTFLNADTSNLVDVTARHEVFLNAETTFEGSFTILAADFDIITAKMTLLGTSIIPIDVYFKGEIFLCLADFKAVVNNSYKFCEVSIISNSDISIVQQYKDVKYNLFNADNTDLNGQVISFFDDINLEITPETLTITGETVVANDTFGDTRAFLHIGDNATTEPTDGIVFSPDGTILNPFGSYSLAQAVYKNLSLDNVTLVPLELTFSYEIDVIWVREKGYGYYIGTTKYPPSGTGWVYISDVNINGTDVPYYVRPYQTTVVWDNSGNLNAIKTVLGVDYFINRSFGDNYTDINFGNILRQYSNFRSFQEVIKFVIGKIFEDPNLPVINYDVSGTPTDSFYDFKTITGENYDGNTLPLAKLMILALSDAIPQTDLSEKTNLSTLCEITWGQITEILAKLGFYPRIEIRTGDHYFIVERKKDVPSDQTIDLNFYNGLNTADGFDSFEKSAARYNSIEFDGLTTDYRFRWYKNFLYRTLPAGSQNYQNFLFNTEPFLFDINDIRLRKNDIYPVDNSMFVLLSTYDTGSVFKIRKVIDNITGEVLNNYDFNFERLIKNYITEIPDSEMIVNGADYSITNANQIEKRKKRKLDFMVNKVSDIDFNKNISVFGNSAEIDNFSIRNYEINLKY